MSYDWKKIERWEEVDVPGGHPFLAFVDGEFCLLYRGTSEIDPRGPAYKLHRGHYYRPPTPLGRYVFWCRLVKPEGEICDAMGDEYPSRVEEKP